MTLNNIKVKIKNTTTKPGCYKWLDSNGNVLYIGKAKNLKNRLGQYLVSTHPKIIELIKNVVDFEVIITNNENDALILENLLINKFKPKYNALLLWTKNYPYIVLTDEKNPRLIYTKNKNIKGKYYGPFASANTNKFDIFKFMEQIFPLRKCKILPKNKCLLYDIGQCIGPCINKIDKKQYDSIKNDINSFFNNSNKKIIRDLEEKEKFFSSILQFEVANKYKELIKEIKFIKKYKKNDIILNSKNKNFDIVGIYRKNNDLCISIYKYFQNELVNVNSQVFIDVIDIVDTIRQYILQFYSNKNNELDFLYMDKFTEINDVEKAIGIKIKTNNKILIKKINSYAREYYETNYLNVKTKHNNENESIDLLKKILNINDLSYIVMFDISNIFKDEHVAGMISIENGKINKSNNRKYIIKSGAISDVDSMNEVIERYITRRLKEKKQLPNLIIMDGGSIQVNAALKILEKYSLNMKVIGLYKDDDHKTKGIIYDNKIIQINNKVLYMYLFNLQEETHNYAINFFRKRKNKKFLKS